MILAGLHEVEHVTVEDVDAGGPAARSDDAQEARLVGTALAGILGWVLSLPADSTLKRDVVVAVNHALHDGDLAVGFYGGSYVLREDPCTLDANGERIHLPPFLVDLIDRDTGRHTAMEPGQIEEARRVLWALVDDLAAGGVENVAAVLAVKPSKKTGEIDTGKVRDRVRPIAQALGPRSLPTPSSEDT